MEDPYYANLVDHSGICCQCPDTMRTCPKRTGRGITPAFNITVTTLPMTIILKRTKMGMKMLMSYLPTIDTVWQISPLSLATVLCWTVDAVAVMYVGKHGLSAIWTL